MLSQGVPIQWSANSADCPVSPFSIALGQPRYFSTLTGRAENLLFSVQIHLDEEKKHCLGSFLLSCISLDEICAALGSNKKTRTRAQIWTRTSIRLVKSVPPCKNHQCKHELSEIWWKFLSSHPFSCCSQKNQKRKSDEKVCRLKTVSWLWK